MMKVCYMNNAHFQIKSFKMRQSICWS